MTLFSDPPVSKQDTKPSSLETRKQFHADLVKDELFSGDFETFTKTFADDEIRKQFHADLVKDELFSGDYDVFSSTFFEDVDLKKKEVTGQGSSPLGMLSATNGTPDFENNWVGQLRPDQQAQMGAPLPEVVVENETGLLDRVNSAAGSVLSGATNYLLSAPLKSLGELGNYLDNKASGGAQYKLDDNPLYRLGTFIEKEVVPKMTYVNKKYEGEFATSTIPTVMGQALGAIITAPKSLAQSGLAIAKESPELAAAALSAFKNLSGRAAVFGAATAADAQYQDALSEIKSVNSLSEDRYVAFKKKNAPKASEKEIRNQYKKLKSEKPEDIAFEAWLKSIPGGMTDALPVAKLFSRMDNILAGGIKSALLNKAAQTGKAGVEGAIEEGIQKAYENFTAQQVYDSTRNILSDVVEEGAAGGTVQALLTAMVGGARARQVGARGKDLELFQKAEAQAQAKLNEIEGNISELESVANGEVAPEQKGGVLSNLRNRVGAMFSPAESAGRGALRSSAESIVSEVFGGNQTTAEQAAPASLEEIETLRQAEIQENFGEVFAYHQERANSSDPIEQQQGRAFLENPRAFYEAEIAALEQELEANPNDEVGQAALIEAQEDLAAWNEINDKYDAELAQFAPTTEGTVADPNNTGTQSTIVEDGGTEPAGTGTGDTAGKVNEKRSSDIKKVSTLKSEVSEVLAPEQMEPIDKLVKIAKFLQKEFGWKFEGPRKNVLYISKERNRVELDIDGLEVNLPEGATFRLMGGSAYPTFTIEDIINAKYDAEIASNREVAPASSEATSTIGSVIGSFPSVTYNGQEGVLRVDGQTVTVETENRVYEIGNVEELQNSSLRDVGLELLTDSDLPPVSETLEEPIGPRDETFIAGENYSVSLNGKTYQNRYSDPFSAITTDENGDVVSVTLDTEDGKKRTFRGANAERIAYEYYLVRAAESITEEQLIRLENEAAQSRENTQSTGEPAPQGTGETATPIPTTTETAAGETVATPEPVAEAPIATPETETVVPTQSTPPTQAASSPTPEPATTGIIPEGQLEKTLVKRRAYDGKVSEGTKRNLEAGGLFRTVVSNADSYDTALGIIERVGEQEAYLLALEGKEVYGQVQAGIFGELIRRTSQRIAAEPNDDARAELEKLQAEILREAGDRQTKAGQYNAMFRHIYQIDNDTGYNLDNILEKHRKRTGRETVTPEEMAKYRKAAAENERLRKQVLELEKRFEERQEEYEGETVIWNIQQANSRFKKTYKQRAKKAAESIRKKLKFKPLELYDVDGNLLTTLNTGVNPIVAWNALVELGARAVEVSGDIADGIKAIKAKLNTEDWYKNLSQPNKDAVLNQIGDHLSNAMDANDPDIGSPINYRTVRQLVEGGITNIEDLVKKLNELHPDMTPREIRDDVTGYSRIVETKKDEIDRLIREMKNIGRAISGLEDIAQGLRPNRSGKQRDEMTVNERKWQKKLREALKGLKLADTTLETEMKTATDVARRRAENLIADLRKEIETGERTAKNKAEIEKDDSFLGLLYELDLVKQRHDEVFNTKEELALTSIQRSIDELNALIASDDIDFKTREKLNTPAIEARRKILQDLRATMQQLREDAGIIQKRRLEALKNATRKRTEYLRTKKANKDYSKEERKPLPADKELIALRAEKLRVQEELDKDMYADMLANQTKTKQALGIIGGVWQMVRAFNATIDASFIGVQGLRISLAHPSIAKKALKASLLGFKSKSGHEAWLRNLKSEDDYPEMKQAGVSITESSAELSAREELFFSGWTNWFWNALGRAVTAPALLADKIAGKGTMESNADYERWKEANIFNALERAAIGYLDTLRVERYRQGRQLLLDDRKTIETHPKDFKDIANLVNTLTGRSHLGPLEQQAGNLATVFYSPRNFVSQIKLSPVFVPIYYATLTPTARKMLLWDVSKNIGFAAAMTATAAAYLNNDDDEETGVEFDPRSSDFLKIKMGNRRLDFWNAQTQMIVLISRMGWGVKTLKGEIVPTGTPNKTKTQAGLVVQTFVNKLHPSAGMLLRYGETHRGTYAGFDDVLLDPYGQPYFIMDEIENSVVPMYINTVRDLVKDEPTALNGMFALTSLIAFPPVSVYESEEQKNDKKVENIQRIIDSQ